MVKFVAGITKLVRNSPFFLIVLWSLISNMGDSINRVASDCLTIVSLGLTIPFSLFRVTHLHLQTGLLPLGGERGRLPLKIVRYPPFLVLIFITLVELVLSFGTQTDPDFFSF